MSKGSYMNGDARRIIADRTSDRELRRQEEGESPKTRRQGHRRPKSADETSVEIDAVRPGLMTKADLTMPPDRGPIKRHHGGEF